MDKRTDSSIKKEKLAAAIRELAEALADIQAKSTGKFAEIEKTIDSTVQELEVAAKRAADERSSEAENALEKIKFEWEKYYDGVAEKNGGWYPCPEKYFRLLASAVADSGQHWLLLERDNPRGTLTVDFNEFGDFSRSGYPDVSTGESAFKEFAKLVGANDYDFGWTDYQPEDGDGDRSDFRKLAKIRYSGGWFFFKPYGDTRGWRYAPSFVFDPVKLATGTIGETTGGNYYEIWEIEDEFPEGGEEIRGIYASGIVTALEHLAGIDDEDYMYDDW